MSALLYKSSFPQRLSSTDDKVYDSLKGPEFDVWKLDDNEMLILLEHMFYDLKLVKEFSIDGETLKRFLLVCKHNYNQNVSLNLKL